MITFSEIGKSFTNSITRVLRYSVVEISGFFQRNRYGVMGTIAFHMLLLIFFLSIHLRTKRTFIESEIYIEIPQELSDQIQKKKEDEIAEALKAKKSEISQSVDELLKSIAVNQNVEKKNADPKQNVRNMIANIQKNMQDYTSDDAADIDKSGDSNEFQKDSLRSVEEQQKQKLLDSLQNLEYNGASSVYYSLKDRYKVFLPIPVFKCEGEGKIMVEIKVDKSGRVLNASINRGQSIEDDCLFEAALLASRKTRFNVSTNSPIVQIGTITYQFVKQ
ncbi:energy transducer TonB family protein [Ancylomarina longa]|uniref:Energy transducer TonB n=1 Tax=Ancylomarina longa TaxID=2487017 RepID=A0A434AFR3_9BACT|nr:energy transducer TonB [Ancylomarina longa]RUT73155.1 energy transducer TonB [Ancylomarina longa]